MYTLSQKRKSGPQKKPVRFMMHGRPYLDQSREMNSILHNHTTIRNHSVQHLSNSVDRERQGLPEAKDKEPASVPLPAPRDESAEPLSKCSKSQRGSISASSTLKGNSLQAGVDVKIEVTPPTTSCKCNNYRWVQVADIIPGKWKGRADAYVDPYPNDDTKPYYWTDSQAASSPNKLTDPPRLNRSRSTAAGGKRITNKFETVCMCLKTGKIDRNIGVTSWGYSFKKDKTKDKKIGPTKSSSPSSFWTQAVAKDLPSYKYKA